LIDDSVVDGMKHPFRASPPMSENSD